MITPEQIAEQLRSCQRNWDWKTHGGLTQTLLIDKAHVLAESVWEIVGPEIARLRDLAAKGHVLSMSSATSSAGKAWLVDCSCGWAHAFRDANLGPTQTRNRGELRHAAHVEAVLNGDAA